LPTSPLAPENYLNQFQQPLLNATEFLTIGYGTEVRNSHRCHRHLANAVIVVVI
jgi:hypothetical protein